MSATGQDIEKFYANAQARDFSRDFLFRVGEIQLAGGISFNEDELVYAKSGVLPARNITNVTAPYMGLNFNIPGNATYTGSEAYSLTFYLDARSALRDKLEAASRIVFDDQFSTGDYNTPTPENYIILHQLAKDLSPISTYRLYGASIRNIDNIEYTIAEGTGTTVALTTTMAYHFYRNENIVVE